ncbi:hypothetical protein FKM82_021021 [Ascaphus truei]
MSGLPGSTGPRGHSLPSWWPRGKVPVWCHPQPAQSLSRRQVRQQCLGRPQPLWLLADSKMAWWLGKSQLLEMIGSRDC